MTALRQDLVKRQEDAAFKSESGINQLHLLQTLTMTVPNERALAIKRWCWSVSVGSPS